MKAAILNDVELHGSLPLQEILCRARSGEIPKKYLIPLIAGRLAEDAANALPDDSSERADLLSVSDGVEDWFRVSNRIAEAKDPPARTGALTSNRPDAPKERG
jgi:hypothetical protein